MVVSNSLNWTITMVTIGVALSFAIAVSLIVVNNGDTRAKSFTIDYKTNTFLMDGKPFRYVSGSFHYFRALPETWEKKLKTLKAAGLNAVDTYVEWATHNPHDGIYNFDGIANIERFLQLAKNEGLYVILRPGPYICAERDNGGIPYWLSSKYSSIQLRTSDENYLKEVRIWYSKLMTRIRPYLYGNGGSIIMVQVENEYGAFPACDKRYLIWLRDETEQYVQGKAVLFTTDIPDNKMECGKIDNVFATTDFGADRIHEIDEIWKTLRKVQPNGPLVNSEFYPGWLTHWQEENQRRDADEIAAALRKILSYGASVNIYMFFGGTNFGFTAGANDFGHGGYNADVTSYDYDAPMDEAGDPTVKYIKIRNVINEVMPLPDIAVPDKEPKMSLDAVKLQSIALLLSTIGRNTLGVLSDFSELPKNFDDLRQFSGLVLYETELPKIKIDPTLLTVNKLCDRALVYVDNRFVGILSRENSIYSLPISCEAGKKLQILVENQGRINFNIANDTKGILGSVTIEQLKGETQVLKNWISVSIPLEYKQLKKLIDLQKNEIVQFEGQDLLLNGPVIFFGQFSITKSVIYDTYFDSSGWGKGVVYINGFNLGRYWPLVGPQKTLYVPKELLKFGQNEIIILEYQKASSNRTINFISNSQLDG